MFLKTFAVALAGLVQAWSFAWPWPALDLLGLVSGQSVWWLQLLSLAVLVRMLMRRQNRWTKGARAAWFVGVFALCWMVGTIWWLHISMHLYGGLHTALAALAVLALAGFLALLYVLPMMVFVQLAPLGRVPGGLVFAACWLLAELLRGNVFTGFPWGACGYAFVDSPFAPLAAWVGVYGLSMLSAWLAYVLAQASFWLLEPAVDRFPSPDIAVNRLGVTGLVVVTLVSLSGVAWLARGAQHTQEVGRIRLALLQGQIPQDEKFQTGSGIQQALNWYGQQLRQQNASLVVAPETALPLLPHQLPEGFWPRLEQHFSRGEQAALIGMPMGNFELGYTNSVVGIKPQEGQVAERYQYDKHHLVPFGEFTPTGFRWFTMLMQIPLSDFKRGAIVQPAMTFNGLRITPHICYEDLFGEELAQQFVQPEGGPDLMVNVSNIAWFGNTIAIDQHLQIARMRALEFQRPIARATNTGATAVIDHQGQVLAQLDRTERGVLVAEVNGRRGATPYARWVGRLGLWPWFGLIMGVLGWAMGLRTRRPRHWSVAGH